MSFADVQCTKRAALKMRIMKHGHHEGHSTAHGVQAQHRPLHVALERTGRPSVLTVNGRPALVVMDAAAWQDVADRLEHARAVAGIREGLDQVSDGRGAEAAGFFEDLDKAPDKR